MDRMHARLHRPVVHHGTSGPQPRGLGPSASPHYKGLITGLRFDRAPSVREGDFIKLKSISLRKRR